MFPEQTTSANASGCGVDGPAMRKPERKRQKIDFLEPMSPSSSSSQTVDSNFEPTVDMMVNDFDDEQTLNEEESLAALENGGADVADEIATLKEESEMPLEELLAKYQCLPPPPPPSEPHRRKKKRSKANPSKENVGPAASKENVAAPEVSKKEESDLSVEAAEDIGAATAISNQESDNSSAEEEFEVDTAEREDGIRPKRSILSDLYPEKSYGKDIAVYEDDEESDAEEEEEGSEECLKTIMIGPAYQAAIPEGLSLYGDILPYENEDKLIWEPSQVSEREVEEYLMDARNIKSSLKDEEHTASDNPAASKTIPPPEPESGTAPVAESKTKPLEGTVPNKVAADSDAAGVVKDNEQALHLLVLCGYDFKEALRRQRLNALPLTDSMSLWSEEECSKFEEGIKEHGKDFVKIRQNQVRTRTMRELVQFYYLWKKSERRDQNFANADTVDHMDIYLNESNDYNTNSSASQAGSSAQAPVYAGKKSHKNPSILAGSTGSSSSSNGNNSCSTNNSKCTAQLNMGANKYYNNNMKPINDSLNVSVSQ